MDEIKITSVDGGAINEAEYNRCPKCLIGFAGMSCFGRRGMGDREDSDDDDDVVLLPPIDNPAVSISSLPDWCPRGIQSTEECSKDLCIEGQHPAL